MDARPDQPSSDREGRQFRQIFIALASWLFSSSIERWPSVATAVAGKSGTAFALRGPSASGLYSC
jgi:hypothetical protein